MEDVDKATERQEHAAEDFISHAEVMRQRDSEEQARISYLRAKLAEQRRRADRLDDAIKWIRDLHEAWHQRWLATDRRGTVSGVSTSLLASVLERIDSALAATAEQEVRGA